MGIWSTAKNVRTQLSVGKAFISVSKKRSQTCVTDALVSCSDCYVGQALDGGPIELRGVLRDSNNKFEEVRKKELMYVVRNVEDALTTISTLTVFRYKCRRQRSHMLLS